MGRRHRNRNFFTRGWLLLDDLNVIDVIVMVDDERMGVSLRQRLVSVLDKFESTSFDFGPCVREQLFDRDQIRDAALAPLALL